MGNVMACNRSEISTYLKDKINELIFVAETLVSAVIPKVGCTPHRWARRKFCGAWRFFSSLPKKIFLTYLNRYKGIKKNVSLIINKLPFILKFSF